MNGFTTHLQLYVVDATVEVELNVEAPGTLVYERHYTNTAFKSFPDLMRTFLQVLASYLCVHVTCVRMWCCVLLCYALCVMRYAYVHVSVVLCMRVWVGIVVPTRSITPMTVL